MEENWGGGRGAGKREVETDCSASNIKKTNLKTTRGDKTPIRSIRKNNQIDIGLLISQKVIWKKKENASKVSREKI